jgi:hypothetical protein
VNKLSAQLILFFFQTPSIVNLFEFAATKYTQNHYLSHLSSENCEINSIKFDLPRRAFQQQRKCPQIHSKRHIPIPPKFSATNFNLFFNEKIVNIQELCAISLNTMKPSPCIPSSLRAF